VEHLLCGYNIANLQQNGVANQLTHLIYAFANVSTPTPACALADTWADYLSPYLPSVSGAAYPGPLYATSPRFGNSSSCIPTYTS
jgi:chitinase